LRRPPCVAATWRIESARIVAAVARRVRDLGVAEELAQDALVAALEHWPKDGMPNNPGAWLMTTALNRALDWLRQRQMMDARHNDMAPMTLRPWAHVVPDFTDALDAGRADAAIGDDLLRLIFTACHPVLSSRRAGGAHTQAAWAAWPPTRSHALFWCPRPPLRSASCAPNARWPMPVCLLRCRVASN
jgi:predicted RNA polymerase sigma factor